MISAANARDMMVSSLTGDLGEKLNTLDLKIRDKAKLGEKEVTYSFEFQKSQAPLFEILQFRLKETYGYKVHLLGIKEGIITFNISWV